MGSGAPFAIPALDLREWRFRCPECGRPAATSAATTEAITGSIDPYAFNVGDLALDVGATREGEDVRTTVVESGGSSDHMRNEAGRRPRASFLGRSSYAIVRAASGMNGLASLLSSVSR